MPKIDFSTVNDIADFDPVPDGQYLCTITDIESGLTKKGDDMWTLRLRIEGGEHNGRLLFDNIIFSDRALPRVKRIFACCGVDVSGEVDLDQVMLLDKRVFVETFQEEREEDTGHRKVRNKIPYNGYHPVTGDEDEPPF